MGLFDVFLSKDKRDDKTREKNIARATDKYKQSPDRMRALELLAQDGSEEALYGILRRFGITYDKSIEDEQEKEWVCDMLISKGQSALPAVRRYLKNAESVSWPLRILSQIAASPQQELEVLEEVLERHEPGYERDPTKKIQLLNHLGGLKAERVSAVAAPYLEDMDEGVRYAAVQVLVRRKGEKDEEVARQPLLQLFTSEDEESLRLRTAIAEGFAELGWRVEGYRPGVEKHLPEAFTLDREGHIKKKP